MSVTYPGIDYSGPGSTTNRDTSNGIRYGVISQHDILQAWADSSEADYGIPDEGTCPHCGNEQHVSDAKWGDTIKCGECEESYEIELPDCYEALGYYLDEPDLKAVTCLNNDVMVIKSPYYTFAQFCSPCVPGAANLNSSFKGRYDSEDPKFALEATIAGFPKAYCFGHDWFEDNKAPYPIFSVETGKLVLPTE